ncbi:MAG: hypothetical protein M3272_05025 [Actinomycetota bacterium]|nr:hypothetical protein [Actinomycetota bacterium]
MARPYRFGVSRWYSAGYVTPTCVFVELVPQPGVGPGFCIGRGYVPATIKTAGDAVMAVFRRPVSALRAILDAQQRLASSPNAPPLYLNAGMHYGPCIATR